MNSKDKTGNKLVASIRKSKTATVGNKASERPASGDAAAKSKTPTAGVGSTARSASSVAPKQAIHNGYSLGRRVWPD